MCFLSKAATNERVFTRISAGYVQVVGQIDQTALNLQSDDYGGEEDPHGADARGNPLGSLLYSSAFGKGPMSDDQQVFEWSFFVGSGSFVGLPFSSSRHPI